MTTCPVCDGVLEPFLRVGEAPVFCNVLYMSSQDALAAPRGEIELGLCGGCGFIGNMAFDGELVRYSRSYENSLHFSAVFDAFAEELAHRLIERYGVDHKDVVDIGCGKGDFLRMLCDGNGNRGVGYDPSYEGPIERVNGANLRFVREYYTAAHADVPADLITCRHVLEHLEAPAALVSALERSTATLYFEMPDAEYMLREAAIWDVIYEHVSYFTAPALRRLFEGHGFQPIEVSTCFGGQYLYIEASRGAAPSAPPAAGEGLARLAAGFRAAYDRKLAMWKGRLATWRREGRAVALWGAGSKGVTYLNAVPGAAALDLVIDLNSRKHGRYVPGTGQVVQGPEALRAASPDVVLVMNRLYEREIGERLAAMDLHPELLVVT